MFDINKCYDCFATEPNSAYFWSGLGENGQDIAAQVAQENGGTTLEMLMDKNKDELISAGFPYDEDLGGFYLSKENAQDWQAISQAYAEQASGDVHAVLGENVRESSVWSTKELPALEKNDNVDRVVSVDSKTGNEKDVLLDKKSGEESSNDSGKSGTNKEGTGNRLNSEKSSEYGSNPTQDDSPLSNKATSSKRGHKPSSTESEPNNKGTERGSKPLESDNNIQNNNSITRGEKPREAPKGGSNAQQSQRGTYTGSSGGEDSRAPTSSSSKPNDKISASNNSAKAADEASKAASEQAAKNTVAKSNGMGM